MAWLGRYRRLRLSGFWTGLGFGISTVLAVQLALGAGDVALNGCRNDATGAIRLLPSKLPAPLDTQCSTSTNPLLHETAISWSQTGPQGAKGDSGATGGTGPAGPIGASG